MQSDQSAGLQPTLPVLAEELSALGIAVTGNYGDATAPYSGIRRYRGQPLRRELLYLITPETAGDFPVDQAAYISLGNVPGKAEHLCCPREQAAEAEEGLRDLFDGLQEAANEINALIYRGATLDDLCELGEGLLENPVSIHDNWFMILARSSSSDAIFPRSGSPWELIPQRFLDEFRIDAEYQKTYQHRQATLWRDSIDGEFCDTIYVNLYDGDVYQGRLLIMGNGRKFRRKDYLIAQLLARQAIVLLKAKRAGAVYRNRGTDDILWDILNGKYTEPAEFSVLMQTLQWEITDHFLCIRVQRQAPVKSDSAEAILHRDLFQAFPGSYVMSISGQQCVLLNLTRSPVPLSRVRHMLSPLCRDYYQYGGISSPVEGIRELPIAYVQAGEALEQAFRYRDERWIVYFWDCALEYMMMRLNTPMQFRHLVAPQLLALKHYDQEKDSQLFETFQAYLENERDIPKTAARLIIHRTTLTYRLKKIQSLIDLDLENPDTRLYLRLSLQMLKREKTATLAPTWE